MKALNHIYNVSCRPKCESYKKVTNDIVLIDNFFENFDAAKEFLKGRDRWKTIPYQGYASSGYRSFFPEWIGKSLIEKYVKDNRIETLDNFYAFTDFYHDEKQSVWGIVNSNYYPHIDDVKKDNTLQHICLVNLNDAPVTTHFYSFKGHKRCSAVMEKEWNYYTTNLQYELMDYYDNKTVNRKKVKQFLDSKKDLQIELTDSIEYKPNQAIVYPADLFHCGDISEIFTEEDPRVLFKILMCYDYSSHEKVNYS